MARVVWYSLTNSSTMTPKKWVLIGFRQQLLYENVNIESSPMSEIFSERLRAVRERRGLSQADLAKKASLQTTAISHFETGTRSPSFDNLRKLSDALTVSTDFLMGRSEKEEMIGPDSDSLFRDIEKLSEEDLQAMRMMKDALLKRRAGSA